MCSRLLEDADLAALHVWGPSRQVEEARPSGSAMKQSNDCNLSTTRFKCMQNTQDAQGHFLRPPEMQELKQRGLVAAFSAISYGRESRCKEDCSLAARKLLMKPLQQSCSCARLTLITSHDEISPESARILSSKSSHGSLHRTLTTAAQLAK